MILAIDLFVRRRIAQPAVDAFQLDPDTWPDNAARAASSAFVISTLGVAGIFAFYAMPMNSIWTIVLGATHVISVMGDVRFARIRRLFPDDGTPVIARVMQLVEIMALIMFLAFVIPYRSAAWTSLVAIFLAEVVVATAASYVSICDRPPPPRRRTSRAPSHAAS